MPEKDKPGLEIQQDLEFQKKEWRAARITWVVLLTIMVATLLGVFGKGPLSKAEASDSAGAFRVEYQRFGRFGASMRLLVFAPPGPDSSVRFALDGALLRSFQVKTITPRPSMELLLGDGVEYRFDGAPDQHAPVIFELQPAARWFVSGSVRTVGARVQFRQFIHP